MNKKKNAITSVVLQIAVILQGMVLPRLILSTFGSEANGLISSITQFLSFISLLEGGLGAVVLADLYSPLEKKNVNKIRDVLVTCQAFFDKLAIAFFGYTVFLAAVYPLYISRSFPFVYTASMVVILSLTTLIQYLFSITYKLYLQADQRLYIVNIISTVTIILNTVSAVIIMFLYPDIHVVKIASGMIYLLQPIVLRRFISPECRIKNIKSSKKVTDNKTEPALKNRWSGFSQNLAHFINMNTDVALLTVFSSLSYVSVYTVYMMAISALKGMLTSVGNGYQSALGKYIAEENQEKLRRNFDRFEQLFWFLGTVCFGTCLLLLNDFVSIYTNGINDADYYQPMFAAIIVLANMLYVVREPYRLLILAAGKFRETNFGAVFEAVLNLMLSLILIRRYDLVGVAVGTFVAILFRLLYFMWYLKKDILYKEYAGYIKSILSSAFVITMDLLVYKNFSFLTKSIMAFCIKGCVCVCVNASLFLLCYYFLKMISKTLYQRT